MKAKATFVRAGGLDIPADDSDIKEVNMNETKEARPAWDGGRLPELMGTTQVARELGVRVQNLDKQVGLPEADQTLTGGRIWPADQIRQFAAARKRRKAA